jgi:fatty acid desaturase
MGIIAHDVSHFSIVTSRLGVRSLELCLFGPNAVPPTIWRRIHNQAHHAETNTEKDPDRPFFEDERTSFTSMYAHLFYPGSFRILPRILVFLHFGPYLLRNIYAALLPGDLKPEIVPYKPRYSTKMKLSIVLEGIFIILLQVFIWHFVGGWWRYLWAGPVSMVITSAIAKGYIFTNHFLNPHCAHTDPVVGSTSLILPGWIDWLHNNVSYHAEHHIFPGMNSKYLPLVSDLLKEHFPERYQRLTYLEAWRRLFLIETWQHRVFEESHTH